MVTPALCKIQKTLGNIWEQCCRLYIRPYKHAHFTETHTHHQLLFSLVRLIFSGPPLVHLLPDVMGGTSLTLSAVLSFFPLKCQASSVLRCSTVDLLPLLSTLLIDAICSHITPLVIKQHFSLPVSGCQH